MRRSTATIFYPFLIAVLAMGYLLFTGPEMKYQPSLRPYQAQMPPSPEGSVPVRNPVATMPTAQQAQEMVQAAVATPEAAARGKVYYGYYCVFCHGERGDGRGPVGESYVPAPADLRSDRAQSLSDGELLRAMLTGTGHDPVLARVVLPEHRPYLVLYVRQLGGGGEVGAGK